MIITPDPEMHKSPKEQEDVQVSKEIVIGIRLQDYQKGVRTVDTTRRLESPATKRNRPNQNARFLRRSIMTRNTERGMFWRVNTFV